MRPAVIDQGLDEIAKAVDRRMKERGLTPFDLVGYGYSKPMCKRVSAFLRGSPDARWGATAAIRLANKLNVPVVFGVRDDARAA